MGIELSPFDKKDILELLDYASKMKQEHRPELKGTNKWDDTDYWVMRIEQLKQIVNGRNTNRSLYGSTLPEPEPLPEDKAREYYRRKRKENDIFNGKDWYENNII